MWTYALFAFLVLEAMAAVVFLSMAWAARRGDAMDREIRMPARHVGQRRRGVRRVPAPTSQGVFAHG